MPPPAGWRWVRLTDVARLESGHTPSRRHPEWWGGEIPWLSLKDAKAHHGGRIPDTTEHTNELGIANSSARVLPANTVCLSRTASVGYVVVMDRPMATSQDFVCWVCSNEVEPDFLKYLLLAEGPGLLRFAAGSVHSTIYFPEVKAFQAAVPVVAEQRRIIERLDDALANIEAAREMAEKNLHGCRELFLGRLQSVFNGVGADWSVRPVAEIARHSLGKMLDVAKNKGDLKPYLRNFNVRWFGFDLSDVAQMRFLPEEASKYTASKGDVLVCEGGEPGRAAIWEEEQPVYFQKAVHRVRFHEPAHARWFLYFLYFQSMSGGLTTHLSGTGIQHLTGAALARLNVPLPPLPQLREPIRVCSRMHAEANTLESVYLAKLARLDELKQSLLQQAFAGEL